MSATLVLVLRILLALALYAFLAAALYVIWKDLHSQTTRIHAPQFPKLTLILQDTPPFIFENTNEVVIGRSKRADLRLDLETVSTRHARLNYHHLQWWVEDLHSTNGSFLNDERIGVPTVLVTGDVLQIGAAEIHIEIDEST